MKVKQNKQTKENKTYKEKTKIIRNRPENNYIIILSIKGERTIAKRKRKYASICLTNKKNRIKDNVWMEKLNIHT